MAYQKRTLIKLHRELWQWLADNPDMEKSDWPKWEFRGGEVTEQENECFACGYHLRLYGLYGECENNCLFVWRSNDCQVKLSEFEKWGQAKPHRRKYWAEKIRDLEVNPIYK